MFADYSHIFADYIHDKHIKSFKENYCLNIMEQSYTAVYYQRTKDRRREVARKSYEKHADEKKRKMTLKRVEEGYKVRINTLISLGINTDDIPKHLILY